MKLFELFAEIKLDDKGVTSGLTAATTKAVVLGNAIYNAGTKLVQFGTNLGKSAIEAAATVEAEEAQFNAAFSSMASTATKALKNVQDSTGILYTRLRAVGTKAFAQLKGAGLDSADAMAAMEKYTNLAADAAAYYDISLEDADARLRSFMRGNTEAGDAIGLFTSETQRNDRAMEKYGKKWLQLTEAQKQMLMLDIAGTIYEQSGAIGQAARESDSWANIMGNLGEAWKIAMAKLGSPVKASISPIIDRITAFVSDPEVQTKIEQFGLGVANGITEFVNKFDEMTKDGGVFDNVQSFINDISEALSGEGTGSVLTAIGVVELNLAGAGERESLGRGLVRLDLSHVRNLLFLLRSCLISGNRVCTDEAGQMRSANQSFFEVGLRGLTIMLMNLPSRVGFLSTEPRSLHASSKRESISRPSS